MELWVIAISLDTAAAVLLFRGIRSQILLGRLARDRFGDDLRATFAAEPKPVRGPALRRISNEFNARMYADPELAHLSRRAQVGMWSGLALLLPALYTTVVLLGRLLS